jgi:hypothetical protein
VAARVVAVFHVEARVELLDPGEFELQQFYITVDVAQATLAAVVTIC